MVLVGVILQLFKRMVDQFDRLIKRKAFLDQYKKEKWFSDGLGEFDEARYVAESFDSVLSLSGFQGDATDESILIQLYLACVSL